MEKLSESAIQDNLSSLNSWELKDHGIEKSFEFKFVNLYRNRVAINMAVKKNHFWRSCPIYLLIN